MNYGFQNERDFVVFFNNKYLYDFDSKTQTFLKELFDGIIRNDERIKAWKNKSNQKTDIFLKYKKYIKGISLKYGRNNSVHTEPIEEFKHYLEQLQIPYKIIEYYVSYHYGFGVDENGHKNFTKHLSAEEYKLDHHFEIDIFNKYINKTKIIVNMIDRFLIRGCNSDYDIDALISGSVDDYVWILKYDLYDLILANKRSEITSPHVCCMTIGPKTRNINGNCKNIKERYQVCIRWNYIRENIIDFKANKKTISHNE